MSDNLDVVLLFVGLFLLFFGVFSTNGRISYIGSEVFVGRIPRIILGLFGFILISCIIFFFFSDKIESKKEITNKIVSEFLSKNNINQIADLGEYRILNDVVEARNQGLTYYTVKTCPSKFNKNEKVAVPSSYDFCPYGKKVTPLDGPILNLQGFK